MQLPDPPPVGTYDIYPGFPIGSGKIASGFDALAKRLAMAAQAASHPRIILDGYGGVDWEGFRQRLDQAFTALGLKAGWLNAAQALLPEEQIERLVAPFLGGDDPLFGTRFTGSLADFFDPEKLAALREELETGSPADLMVLYGCGAALAGAGGYLVYVDVPKYEIQLRSRRAEICNLGTRQPASPKSMYKRFYFVDWVALNAHKAALLPRLELFVDNQDRGSPSLISGDDLRRSLSRMSHSYFRVRPWFEPGAWGGQWMMEHIPQLSQAVPNYAWSFELIVPENGLLLESDGQCLECSFDLLMYQEYQAVLGESAGRFQYEFPIRFDFLDTFSGGNLSLQCHPLPEYIRQHFGETFTQDEAYYILDCKPGARVYLGFQDDIDPPAFRRVLEDSQAHSTPVDVEKFVHTEPAHQHDLFLIPGGTIHCSGADNLVLEISSTPYIFTFKMYDWLRLDLDGKPRPLNIARAFENLCFERKGELIHKEHISHPVRVAAGEDWELVHLPTHPVHFYDVYRVAFSSSVELETRGSCQVMNLVQGRAVSLSSGGEPPRQFNYAETFTVPAAAGRFRLTNLGGEPAMLVMACLKPGAGTQS